MPDRPIATDTPTQADMVAFNRALTRRAWVANRVFGLFVIVGLAALLREPTTAAVAQLLDLGDQSSRHLVGGATLLLGTLLFLAAYFAFCRMVEEAR